MKLSSKFLIAAAAALTTAMPANGQATQQAVGMGVGGISVIAVQGTTALIVPAHRTGAAPTTSTASATYAITTNEENRQLSVSIDEPLPAGVTLTMNVASPAGGIAYSVNLSTQPQTAVAGISRLNASGLAITYSMTTASGARLSTALVRNVTMTIESGSEPRRAIAAAGGLR